MNRRGTSRRSFLRGLGSAAALAPFMPVLDAYADGTAPTRVVFLFTPHGTIRENWLPSGSETSFTLSPILAPLARHKERLVILDGLNIIDDSVGAPHTKGSPLLWTASPLLEDTTFSRDDGDGIYYYGWNSAESIDQHIARALTQETPYRSLQFGVRSGGNHPGHRMSYVGPAAPLAPEDDPYAMYDRLFNAGSSAGSIASQLARRRSILDLVSADLGRIRSKVPSADQDKLDAHLAAIRDIEYTLDTSVVCEPPTIATDLTTAMGDVPRVWQAQWQMLARALACDMTRVASMQFAVAENDHTLYEWLGIDYEIHHLITHSNTDEAKADLSILYAWYSEQLAYFLDLLDAIPEGDGTVLDHTLVVWGSEIGRGWDHSFDLVPFVVAGGGNGAWPTGRFLDAGGVEHNRLLVSIARAMGVDIDTFGGTDPSVGGLPGLL